MARFELSVIPLLVSEGGFTDNPNDPGGPTKYGISQRFLEGNNLYEFDKNRNGKIDAEDIKDMTLEEAKELYEGHWWNPYDYENIKYQRVADKLLDTAVQFGQNQAVKILQQAYNKSNQDKLEVDGIIGEKTLEAINNSCEYVLLGDFRSEIAAKYREKVDNNPRLKIFLNGWIKRAFR